MFVPNRELRRQKAVGHKSLTEDTRKLFKIDWVYYGQNQTNQAKKGLHSTNAQ